MSDYGVMVYNDNLNLIIDSKYRNHILVQSGSSTFTDSVTITLDTPTSKCPLIAIRNMSTSYVVSLWKVNKTGDNFVSFTI